MNPSGQPLPQIRYARFDTLTIYEISDSELESLHRGSPDSIFLNIGIFLISCAITLIVTLLTTHVESDRLYIVFVVIAVVAFVGAIVLLLLWWRNRQSVSNIVATIRKRLPPEGTPEPLPVVEAQNGRASRTPDTVPDATSDEDAST